MGIGGSIHKSKGWMAQWERARRWHLRLKVIGSQCRTDGNTEDDWDFVYSFFQNCFCLRDWLEESGLVSKDDLNRLINSHIELGICRDICNGTKHFNIKFPSVDGEFSLLREYVPASDPAPRPHINQKWLLLAGNEQVGSHRFDIFDLADRCMNLWEAFLNDMRLLRGAADASEP